MFARGAKTTGTEGAGTRTGISIASQLTLEAVDFAIGEHRILSQIDVTLRTGSITCLLGPSGSGKSTLLRIAAGLERPTHGRVLLDGRELTGPRVHVPPERRNIAMVFQDHALFPHLSVTRNVAFGVRRMARGERERHVAHLLGRVGLAEKAARMPHELSGGEQQRVALARALAPKPAVVLLDEPFSGLDARLRDAVRDSTLAILRETRATAAFVTHDPSEALRIADQIVLLDGGRVVQQGDARSLFRRPSNVFTASFFSDVNVFPGTVRGGRVQTPLGPVPINARPDGSSAIACVRTGAVVVEAAASGDAPRGARTGRVVGSRFLGEDELVEIAVDGADAPVRARLPAGTLPFHARDGRTFVHVYASLDGAFAFPDGP